MCGFGPGYALMTLKGLWNGIRRAGERREHPTTEPTAIALTELSRALLDSSVDLLDTKSALGPFHVLWVPKRYAGS